jgi:putative ATP-dependent endonuclease of the OLD family
MRISRIRIKNFRNFADVDFEVGDNAVFIGENKVGKSNLLFALRLILDPALPDSGRYLREEDFWDGLPRPLKKADQIAVSVDFADFEDNKHHLTLLGDYLVQPSPMVARLTYKWAPLPTLIKDPVKESDYEFAVYGGADPNKELSYDVRRRLPMELIPALRDSEGDLARWSRSPLRPLLDAAASTIDRSKLDKLALAVDAATGDITKIKEVKAVADSIADRLKQMVGSVQSLETVLRFSPADADKLIRALRIFIDGGRRSISDASLGSANLLYFALKSLEHDKLIADGERDFVYLAIEEPEAHLHPVLQRLIFRNYLHPRIAPAVAKSKSERVVLMTTHSPHIASVTRLRDFVLLRWSKAKKATVASSTANVSLSDHDAADLERYMDVTRGEVLFSRGVVLVEGDAEKLLVPVLAAKQGFDLDELGIVVANILGTNFAPYLKLLGPRGLDIPIAALTDCDPVAKGALGPDRVVNQMVRYVMDSKKWDELKWEAVLKAAPECGVFINEHTLEVDLFKCGLAAQFAQAMGDVGAGKSMKGRMKEWAKNPKSLDADHFLRDIERVGKGRFAQRLASIIADSKATSCPGYISEGIAYVVERTRKL